MTGRFNLHRDATTTTDLQPIRAHDGHGQRQRQSRQSMDTSFRLERIERRAAALGATHFTYELHERYVFMAALRNRCGHYIFVQSCGFFGLRSFFIFPRLISAVADWMSAILAHMVWP